MMPSTNTDSNNKDNRLFYAALIAAALIFVFLALPLLTGRVYTHDDLSRYHLPFRFFYANSLASGDGFAWLPNIFCGFYLHGEGQVGMFHPLHLLLYRILPLAAAFNIEFLLSFPLMAAGMFLFLRRWNMPRSAAMLGSIIYSFSGFHLLHYMHMNATMVAAHTPWLLIALDVIMRGNDKRNIAIAWTAATLLTASQALLGHPPTMWLSMIAEGSYILLLLLSPPLSPPLFSWAKMKVLFLAGAAKGLGILLGGIQLLPHWDMATHSARNNASLDYLQWPSVHPTQLVQLFAPYFYNNQFFEGIPYELKTYNGAIPLLLLAVLLVRRRGLGPEKKLVMGAAVLGALSLVMALGKYGYLHRLQLALPLVGMFRTPCRYVMLFHLATAIIAAAAFADISKIGTEREKLAWKTLWPLALFFIVASILPVATALLVDAQFPDLFGRSFAPNLSSIKMSLLGPAIFLAATVIVLLAARGVRLALVGIILFAALDQGAYGLSYIRRFPARDIETFLDSKVVPPDATRYRIESRDNPLLMKGISLSDGYASINPARHLDKMNPSRLKVAGASWIWSKKLKFQGGTSHGIMLPEPLPRARLATRVLVSQNPDRDIETISVENTALVSQELDLVGGAPGKATITRDRPGMIDISTEAESRQLLILSESYHEGWRVTVDGEAEPVIQVYGDFMGCVVEAGKHDVAFAFRPDSLRLGAWLSAIGAALTIAFAAALFRSSSKEKRRTLNRMRS